MFSEFKTIGRSFLEELENDGEKFAVVLFGRSYNAFAAEANLGIPQKFASRDIAIIPYDMLPSDELESFKKMYWGTGNQILRSARFVKNHSQLYGTFITNFSCGPDSFIIGYFRSIMGNKPSLTLELDSHSADAGINTRIEAALDIIKSFRELSKKGMIQTESAKPEPLQVLNSFDILDSDGIRTSLDDKNVKMLIPNMGRVGSEALAAVFRYSGINSEALPVYDFDTLTLGRGNTSCKECLPLILTAGSLLRYCGSRLNPDEKTLFFMAEGTGPCRLGQYHIFLQNLIREKEIRNMGIYTLSDEDSYGGLGDEFFIRGWAGTVISDILQNIFLALNALAENKELAVSIFEREKNSIISSLGKDELKTVYKQLEASVLEISKISKIRPYREAPKIALIGEIFVRNDEFSRMDIIDRLCEKGMVVRVAPIGEYIHYSDYLTNRQRKGNNFDLKQFFRRKVKNIIQTGIEKRINRTGW